MAKADDTTITDWIWLPEALDLAVDALGSVVGAKELLIEWLAAGSLPWDCMQWKALDAEGIAEFEQSLKEAGIVQLPPSGPYYKGDPRFWGSNLLDINWKDNAAESVVDGAYARGIKVPRARLLELLPGESREGEEVRGAGAWIAAEAKRMKNAGEIPPGIRISEFARELERRMLKAADSDKSPRPITWRSINNELRNWGLWPIDLIK
jgi:hypothetical protein